MKNLKRYLCLVLAIVMCLSTFVTANAASFDTYPDAEDVTYDEAMDVLVALGIINGKDGKIDPKGLLTREEAAKILNYICEGKAAAEARPKTSGIFNDVEAGRWSAGFITYCYNAGIINGVGDTDGDGVMNFNPTGNVTGYAFLKMLLGALGYGANGEFLDSAWQSNTLTFANKAELFEDMDRTTLDLDAPATREQAMQYAFNAMTEAMKVNYSSLVGYWSGESIVDEVYEQNEYLYTLAYEVYKVKQVAYQDDFGRLYYEWAQNGKVISDAYAEEPTKTYTNKVSAKNLYNDLGKVFEDLDSYTVDGLELMDFDSIDTAAGYRSTQTEFMTQEDRDDNVDLPYGTSWKNDAELGRNASGNFGGRGVQTLVYTEADYAKYGAGVTVNTHTLDSLIVIVEINTYLAQVLDIDGKDMELEVYIDDADGYEITYKADDAAEFEGIDEDDFILVTVSDYENRKLGSKSTVETIAIPEVITAKVDGFGSDFLRINGTKYNFAKNYYVDDAEALLDDYLYGGQDDFESTFNFYLDPYGNLIGSVTEIDGGENDRYIYLNEAYAQAYSPFDGEAYVLFDALFMNGAEKVIEGSVRRAGTDDATIRNRYDDGAILIEDLEGNEDDDDHFPYGHFYAYTVSGNSYTLKRDEEIESREFTAIDFDRDGRDVIFGDNELEMDATTSTKLVVIADRTRTYTGYRNFPDIDDLYDFIGVDEGYGYKVFFVPDYERGEATGRLSQIYIVAEYYEYKEEIQFAFYDGEEEDEIESDNDGTYVYTMYADGEEKTFDFERRQPELDRLSDLKLRDVVTLEDDDNDGYWDLTEDIDLDYTVWNYTEDDAGHFELAYVGEHYFTLVALDADGEELAEVEGAEGFSPSRTRFNFGDEDIECKVFDIEHDGKLVETSDLRKGKEVVVVTGVDENDLFTAYYIFIID